MTKTMAKGYKGMGMEGSVARWYEKTTRKDMNQYQELAVRLEANLPAGSDVLEVAPGPGFLSIEAGTVRKAARTCAGNQQDHGRVDRPQCCRRPCKRRHSARQRVCHAVCG